MFNFENVFKFAEMLQKEKGVMQLALDLRIEVIHPVFTTMLPRAIDKETTTERLQKWCTEIKNDLYNGQAGLQLSINSTCKKQRNEMFNFEAHPLWTVSQICRALPYPIGRKYCLNFALASGYEVDAKKLATLFDPEWFMVKITPIHNNTACKYNNIETVEGYQNFEPYRQAEADLIKAGFDVLIFVPSIDEEESLVTCGNAVLSKGN